MAKYTNSPLVEYTHISPYRNSPRNQPITKVTWHHTAGVCTLEQFDSIVHRPGRNMSSNYMVDKDARVGLFCPESDRCWCSSSSWNDNRAVVLEISNSSTGEPWPISDKVYKKCIELTVDICKRNGIKKLTYTGDKNGSLTFHRFYAATGCLPSDTTELLTPEGWILLRDIKIGDTVAAVDPKTLHLKWSKVENRVRDKIEMVYTVYGMTVTGDHRVLCNTDPVTQQGYDFKTYDELDHTTYRIPGACFSSHTGLKMTSSEMVFLLEYQKIGSIDENGNIEFRCIMDSQRSYLYGLLTNLKFSYEKVHEDLGPVCFIVDDKRAKELVDEYMSGKDFNWKWTEMDPSQFSYFIYKVTCHEDGTWRRVYKNDSQANIDVVQAICAMNDRGTHYHKKTHTLTIGDSARYVTPSYGVTVDADVEVSCITVDTGAFIMRQNGFVTITGNCPGTYIFSRAQKICDDVNAQLVETPTPEPAPSTLNKGDLVKIKEGAVYYGTTTKVPTWVLNENWYVDSVNNDRVLLGYNDTKTSNINSAVYAKDVTIVKDVPADNGTPTTFQPYTKKLTKGTSIYSINCGTIAKVGTIQADGVYTIVDETVMYGVKYGKLASGAGWVVVGVDSSIKTGDWVKVLNPVTYDGKKFKVYNSKYKVIQLVKDRAVISADGKNVTAAVNVKNLQKV